MRVPATGETLKGLDVSHHNGHIDWVSLKGKAEFIFMKCTEGLTVKDPLFAHNWIDAKSNACPRGAYHFFHPDKDPAGQANHFLQVMGKLEDADLPPVLDFEVTDGASHHQQVAGSLTWLKLVEAATHRRPIIYASPGFIEPLGRVEEFLKYPLWVANYGQGLTAPKVPEPWKKWAFWQFSESGKIPGVGGQVDLNWFNGSKSDLRAFITGSKVA